jgi:hypothetical protein
MTAQGYKLFAHLRAQVSHNGRSLSFPPAGQVIRTLYISCGYGVARRHLPQVNVGAISVSSSSDSTARLAKFTKGNADFSFIVGIPSIERTPSGRTSQ